MKTALITGCSSGIGYLTALKFARNGYRTYASMRNTHCEGAEKLIKIASDEKLELEIIEIDVTKQETIDKAISYIKDHNLNIDVLVNNAGFGYLGPIEEFTIDEIKAQYETNVFGVLRMVKAVAPIMRLNHFGTIVNISSINGVVPFPLFSIYSSSKYAIETLSEGLHFELGHFGIRVIIVEPGSFLTNFATNRKHPAAFGTPQSAYQELVGNFFSRYQKTHDKAKNSLVSKVLDAQIVADTIFKAASSKNPRLRYMVGNDALIFATLRKLLPQRIWDLLLHRAYKW